LLLDDSTRGIDIEARQEIHNIIRRLNRLGLVTLFYSSDPAEIVQIADRIAVFADGAIIGELSGEQKTEHNVITLMNSSADSPPPFSIRLHEQQSLAATTKRSSPIRFDARGR
jgi:ABC-type multidrug transport system ATPase subunit